MEHEVISGVCQECYIEDSPFSCKCGGLVHCEMNTFDDWDYAVAECDKCGKSEQIVLQESWMEDLRALFA